MFESGGATVALHLAQKCGGAAVTNVPSTIGVFILVIVCGLFFLTTHFVVHSLRFYPIFKSLNLYLADICNSAQLENIVTTDFLVFCAPICILPSLRLI